MTEKEQNLKNKSKTSKTNVPTEPFSQKFIYKQKKNPTCMHYLKKIVLNKMASRKPSFKQKNSENSCIHEKLRHFYPYRVTEKLLFLFL